MINMASHANIVSSNIPQLSKESILDGNNYMDWGLLIKMLLQYMVCGQWKWEETAIIAIILN
jgi:hypothetical protein